MNTIDSAFNIICHSILTLASIQLLVYWFYIQLKSNIRHVFLGGVNSPNRINEHKFIYCDLLYIPRSLKSHPAIESGLVRPLGWSRSVGDTATIIRAQTWREVLHPRTPRTLLTTQSENKLLSFEEEAVIEPILSVRLAIQSSLLNEHILIGRVEVDVANGCRLARDGALDADAFEVRWSNKVHILAGVGEQAHHGKCDEAAHGAAVVVAW